MVYVRSTATAYPFGLGGAVFARVTVKSVGFVPAAPKVIWLLGLPKVSVVAGANGPPVRFTAPTTSNVPVEGIVLGCVKVFVADTVMSLPLKSSTPATELSLVMLRPLALLLVRLLKVVAVVPLIVWPAPPLKMTVPVAGVNVPPLLTQLLLALMVVAVPAAKVPAVSVTTPVAVSVVVLPPTLNVPPPLF